MTKNEIIQGLISSANSISKEIVKFFSEIKIKHAARNRNSEVLIVAPDWYWTQDQNPDLIKFQSSILSQYKQWYNKALPLVEKHWKIEKKEFMECYGKKTKKGKKGIVDLIELKSFGFWPKNEEGLRKKAIDKFLELYDRQLIILRNISDIEDTTLKIKPIQHTNSKNYDIFISFASPDKKIATELKKLIEKKNIKCFLSEKDLKIGKKWEPQIKSALKSSKIVLIILTPKSVDRPWVLLETGAAWILGKNILPVFQGINMSDLPEAISSNEGHPIATPSDYNNLVKKIKDEYF
jgi:TIR domain-containing protein